VMSRDIEDK